MKYIKLGAAILGYLIALLATYLLYIKFLRVDVVFYASLAAAFVATVLFALPLFSLRLFSEFSTFEKLQQILICVLLGYVFSISVPTVIDRSLSFYILEKLQQRGGGIKLSKFDYIFTSEYMREHRLVDVRITEQVESGTIYVDGDCVKLTGRGDMLASFSRFFRQNFLPKERLLRGAYTGELTDPFARSDETPDYLCE